MVEEKPATLPTAFAAGRYRVRRSLGEGSQKRVYLAYDTRLDRDVALAIIKTEGLDDAGRTRVRHEAQAMGRLGDHPHIVTMYDIGDEEGQSYIVSQFMVGGSVEGLLENSQTLPVEEALRIADHICRALEHAHAHGVIHRDLKPANVWLTADGTAKLGDFGLAVERHRSRTTVEGMMVGTVAYMAPEQALGKTVDARSDLYALGATLYEMVTGRPPFVGDGAVVVVSQHLHTAPVAPSWHNPDLPRALEIEILRLLEKDPSKRPPHAAAVREALTGVAATRKGSELADKGPEPTSTTQRPATPSNPLDRLDAGVFVGREKELTALRAAAEDALSGRGRIVLLAGEPGIGKTRTTQELATYAHLRGMQVLWGRGYEGGGAPAYWPWVQAIRTYVYESAPQELLAEMGPGAADIAQAFSAVRERLPDLPGSQPLEPEHQRFRLFDSLTTFLKNAAARRALLLVLDDLHWAGEASLLLLQFVAREMADARLMIVGTYREEEVQPGETLFQVLAELPRAAGTRRLSLAGLGETEVADFIQRSSRQKPSAPLVSAIWRQTEGNPFFVGEVVRWLVTEERLEQAAAGSIGVPPSVRETIGRRLERLSSGCNRVLTVAAVVGRDFDVRLLRQVGLAETEASRLASILGEAVAARVIVEVPDSPGHYRFAHALTRETLYAELTPTHRLRLHQQIGGALETLHAPRLEPYLNELAYHFGEAAPLGEVDRAIEYARKAGERATVLLAYEETVAHYERALRAFKLKDEVDERERGTLLLELGRAQWWSGRSREANETFRKTADIGRQHRAPKLLARAALGTGSWHPTAGIRDVHLEQLLEEACAALGNDESALRARALAQLAVWHQDPKTHQERSAISREAVELARRVGDPSALAFVLHAACLALWDPTELPFRLSLATEEVALTAQLGDKFLAADAHFDRAWNSLQVGDMPLVDAEIETCAVLAAELRHPRYVYRVTHLRAMRALLDGRFAESESLARSILVATERVAAMSESAAQMFGVILFDVRRQQGRLGELKASVAALVERFPSIPAWRCVLALIYSEAGCAEQARNQFAQLAAQSFADLPRDWHWLASIDLLADVCTSLVDDQRAAMLYELLRPHAEHYIVLGDGAVCFGAASRSLGQLAGTMRRWEAATRHFEAALAMNRRIGARPWVAHTQDNYAAMLLKRDASGDRAKALPLLNAAIDTAQQLGMRALVERALAHKLKAEGVDPSDSRSSIHVVATTVQEERPDLHRQAAPDGTITMLFSDIEAFATLTERVGDTHAAGVLRAHNRIIREQLRRHDGFEVKSERDGFMVAFQSARRALLCAIAVQRAMAGYAAEHPEESIRVRIGLHTGEATKEREDFFETMVNFAAHISGEARGGEIVASSVLQELTAGAGEIRYGPARAVALKGVSGVRTLFTVEWAGEPHTDTGEAATLPPNVAVLRHEGAYWTLIYLGGTGRLKDTRGLQYLAQLLRHSGQEFHVLDMVQGPGTKDHRSENRGRGTQNVGLDALDSTAKVAYRRRIAELREELEEAEHFNDAGRADRAGAEIEKITEQLASAVGLGGRDRQAASTTERARSAVTQRIKTAIKKISESHPSLADHLARHVKTGAFCVYLPDMARPIEWQL